ncbi:free fatty acid receptor 3-like [Astyanax mexicanus]|uniref:free fatty acid receptor 3-like n=1 Tax=Astyanax mexicanus TaxID=7994 RepID=UPI0020CB4DD6|nr:free fatty acid receptor 3-like [Astyanax mexicanus]
MEDRQIEHIMFLSTYIVTFLIGFPANAVAFFIFVRKIFRKPIPIDIFLLNLTVSDLIFLSFLPIKMKEAADRMIWNMPYILCQLNIFLFFLPIYSSILFLTAISAERFVCVAFPVLYKARRRIIYCLAVSVSFWVLAVSNASVAYWAGYNNFSENDNISEKLTPVMEGQQCYANFTKEQLKVLLPVRLHIVLVFFCIPFVVCWFCYINFIRILSKLPHIGRRRKLRAIGLALGTLLVFCVCFAPYNASHVVGYIKRENPPWRMKAVMLSTLNASLDPVIFYCTSWEVRKIFKRGLKRLCGKTCTSVSSNHSTQ